MSRVLVLRGTNGSGKSSVVFELMARFGVEPLRVGPAHNLFDVAGPEFLQPGPPDEFDYRQVHRWGQDRNVRGYYLGPRATDSTLCVVLGRYPSQCGGADTIMPIKDAAGITVVTGMEQIRAQALMYANQGHNVLVEGMIVSSGYKPWVGLFQNTPHELLFANLNTPFKVCVERVAKRRRERAANEGKEYTELDSTDNMKNKHYHVENSTKGMRAYGARVVWIDYRQAALQVAKWLKFGQEPPTGEGYAPDPD